MHTVRHVLEAKGHEVWSTSPESSVFAALGRLAEKDIGALLVMEDDRVVGIFSERDYARKVALQGKDSRKTTVGEVMTARVLGVHQEQTIHECMALMTAHRIRHLPVMEAGRVVGVISIGDVVKTIIAEQQFKIEQLENYITGERA